MAKQKINLGTPAAPNWVILDAKNARNIFAGFASKDGFRKKIARIIHALVKNDSSFIL